MHILGVISSLTGGGAQRVMLALAQGWDARGHRVTLVTINGVEADAYPVPAEVHRIALGLGQESRSLSERLSRNLVRWTTLRRTLRSSRPDVVVSFGDVTNVRVLLSAVGLGIPVVVAERTVPCRHPIGWAWHGLRRLSYPLAARLVVQTEALRPWARRRVGAGRVAVIPNPGPDIVPLASPSREPLILASGRLSPEKGFDLLLTAFATVAPRYPEWNLVILGEGPERARLEQSRDTLGLSGRVELPGWVPDPWPFYRRAGVFVLASRFEGFPNVLLEAMGTGCACIATDCPSGPAEIIRPGADGILVPTESADALAAALERLISDPVLRTRLGAGATAVRERYGVGAVADRWLDLFGAVTAGH